MLELRLGARESKDAFLWSYSVTYPWCLPFPYLFSEWCFALQEERGGITRAGITGRLEAGTLSMEEEEW